MKKHFAPCLWLPLALLAGRWRSASCRRLWTLSGPAWPGLADEVDTKLVLFAAGRKASILALAVERTAKGFLRSAQGGLSGRHEPAPALSPAPCSALLREQPFPESACHWTSVLTGPGQPSPMPCC